MEQTTSLMEETILDTCPLCGQAVLETVDEDGTPTYYPKTTSQHQWRIMIPSGENAMGCQWRDEPPRPAELRAWQKDFPGNVWVESREVTYGPPERVKEELFRRKTTASDRRLLRHE